MRQNQLKIRKITKNLKLSKKPKWATFPAEIRSGPLVFEKCENGSGCAISSAYRSSICKQAPARPTQGPSRPEPSPPGSAQARPAPDFENLGTWKIQKFGIQQIQTLGKNKAMPFLPQPKCPAEWWSSNLINKSIKKPRTYHKKYENCKNPK